MFILLLMAMTFLLNSSGKMLLLKTEDVPEEELSSQNNPEMSGLDYASHVPAHWFRKRDLLKKRCRGARERYQSNFCQKWKKMKW